MKNILKIFSLVSMIGLFGCSEVEVSMVSSHEITEQERSLEEIKKQKKIMNIVETFKESITYFKDDLGICWGLSIPQSTINNTSSDALDYNISKYSASVVSCALVGL